jgi:histo-blood group ABO system transferase
MLKKILCSVIFICFFTIHPIFGANIGLLIMATGKYISFTGPLIKSADKHFCTDHNVTYFIFTDSKMESTDNIKYIYQKRLGWPFDTMMRFEVYYNSKDILSSQDYLFACDADMLFVNNVGDEILGERVATLHPGFFNKPRSFFSYDTNPDSKACISDHEGENYFAGGFYGGMAEEVLQITKTCSENITNDFERGIIAVWHDESHWNRYCIDNKPTVILDPSYCYPGNLKIPYIQRLVALDKNHKEMREP